VCALCIFHCAISTGDFLLPNAIFPYGEQQKIADFLSVLMLNRTNQLNK
jgi:hypothetical protein